MTNTERDQLCVVPPTGYDPIVARWVWQLADARRLTVQALEGIAEEALRWQPDAEANSIGTLLYHIVVIELDWLYVEILERPNYIDDAKVALLLPYPDRDGAGRLTVVHNETLAVQLERMTTARQLLLDELRSLDAQEFYRLRHLDSYDVTPEWAIYHLIQHETEHRGEIAALRRQAEYVTKRGR